MTTTHRLPPGACADVEERRRCQRLLRPELASHQLKRLQRLLAEVVPLNRLLSDKVGGVAQLASLSDMVEWAFTYKDELSPAAPSAGVASNLTYPRERYVRLHRTSGTRGRPLVVLDTPEDWQWWIATWQFVLDAADVQEGDRAFLAFSFGPFIGFWSAFDALVARGVMAIPGGGMKTLSRLELMQTARANVLLCTPSYALHLAEVASTHQMPAKELGIRTIIVAGEPGGSIVSVRERLESQWGARVVDHSGATEVGPWGFADRAGRGLRVIESEFVAEFLSLETGRAAVSGELSELVLTPLGRYGAPVIRYRTGDVVRPRWPVPGDECQFVLLEGGVLGRVDDMMIIRGVNVFPSAIEHIVRGFPEIIEYRLTARKRQSMDELEIEIEDRLQAPQRVAAELSLRLGLRVEVRAVPLGSLPRFEGKGQRFVDLRE